MVNQKYTDTGKLHFLLNIYKIIRMNINQKIGAVICAVFVTGFALMNSAVYAQTPSKTQSDAIVNQQYIELVRNVFAFVLQNYVEEVDAEKLYKGALEGLMNAFDDPYTQYMDTSDQRSITDTTSGQFGGVGLQITKPTVSTADNPAYVEVSNPIEGTPGWRAGIVAGDKLIAIDGTGTADISMDDVLSILRGKVGTPVEVTVRRGKGDKAFDFKVTLERALIEVPTVKYGMIDDGGATGYLKIIEFTPLTPDRVQDALDYFESQNYQQLIIDLRNNPGGLISSVEAVADKFIDEGVIVSTKGRYPQDNTSYKASRSKTTMKQGIPIVVLINGGSASASEILSGALKDTKKAYLVGENSYGKGSVQQPIPLPFDDGIKLTIARYYSPSDTNIDKVGIPPDEEVLFAELTEEQAEAYIALLDDDVVNPYVEEHPDMTEAHIAEYAETLAQTYKLEPRMLRRIIRLAVNKYKGDPLYDLDWDVQLTTALKTVRRSDFNSLLAETKTLKEIAEAKKMAEAEADTAK